MFGCINWSDYLKRILVSEMDGAIRPRSLEYINYRHNVRAVHTAFETNMSSPRPVILCFVKYYLPGYRSGGPLRTIVNFIEHFGDEFDIRIVTTDRDVLDTSPYPDVVVDSWNTVGRAQVFYASQKVLTLRGIARLLRETPHDLLYLNSYLAVSFTTLPLLARRLGMAPRKPCVLARAGNFHQAPYSSRQQRNSFLL